MRKKLIQIIAELVSGDGIGGVTMGLHQSAKRLGYESEICALVTDLTLQEFKDPNAIRLKSLVKQYGETDEAVFVYQYGIHNAVLDPYLETARITNRVLFFQNLTPARFFLGWNRKAYLALRESRSRLETLLQTHWSITALSHYSLQCLPQTQIRQTLLSPVMPATSLEMPQSPADPVRRSSGDVPTLLFVGRFAPNKRQDLLIFLVRDLFKSGIPCRLILAGKQDRYLRYLRFLAKFLGVSKYIQFFVDQDQATIQKLYDSANYFVIASEHEGFCVPILEAVGNGLLPIARPFAAVGEIMKNTETLASDTNYLSFVDCMRHTLLHTFRHAGKYASSFNSVLDQIEKNSRSHLTPEQFIGQIMGGAITSKPRPIGFRMRSASGTEVHSEPNPQRLRSLRVPVSYRTMDFVRGRVLEPALASPFARLARFGFRAIRPNSRQ